MSPSLTDRGDFDRAVSERFPNARRTRKELPTGWEDTFRVGFVEVSIRVWDTRKTGKKPWDKDVDQMIVEVNGVRTSIDGTPARGLWRRNGDGWVGAMQALDELRETLLGLAHGLSHATGRKPRPRRKNIFDNTEDELPDL